MNTRPCLPLLAAALAATTGCSRPHTRLFVPAPQASAQERLEAYESLRPAAQSNTLLVDGNQVVGQTADFVVLGEGQRVYHPEDLLEVVPPDSATAHAARRSAEARSKGSTWMAVGIGIMLVGTAVLAYSLTSTPDVGDPEWDAKFERSTRYGLAGAGVLLLGSGIGVGGSVYYGREAHEEKVTAFATYEKDLRRQLVLCVDGLHVVPCMTP